MLAIKIHIRSCLNSQLKIVSDKCTICLFDKNYFAQLVYILSWCVCDGVGHECFHHSAYSPTFFSHSSHLYNLSIFVPFFYSFVPFCVVLVPIAVCLFLCKYTYSNVKPESNVWTYLANKADSETRHICDLVWRLQGQQMVLLTVDFLVFVIQ